MSHEFLAEASPAIPYITYLLWKLTPDDYSATVGLVALIGVLILVWIAFREKK